ncbi:MAG: hypothetical protein COT84_07865 [Chlamydiae bacterium CG10_big_fil_rev_8_21_14_0_10_35_9]|nr:MAG: hypothetical protein COT84_07865 [Chlamydiae bacterium CG10_big_fil_rev_8_21_14_0_10_35_9]
MNKLFVFLFIFFQVHAEIIEINHIEDLHDYIDKTTLVIFDIDNTLIEPAQTLGSDQWFYYRRKQYQKEGYTSSDALEKALSEWMAVQCITDMKLVEQEAKPLIDSLQEKKICIMGLTTRGMGLATRTIHQLKDFQIHLDKTAPSKEEVFFENTNACLFRNGILFTAGTDKGLALQKLLEKIGCQPKKIVFVNDKKSHLLPVEIFCEKQKIPFIGLRYGYLDEKVYQFNGEVAEVQFEAFKKILSDEKALESLDNRF